MRTTRPLAIAAFLALLSAVSFAASPFGCELSAEGPASRLTLGPTGANYYPSSLGKIRGVAIFVDFPDAPAAEDPAQLFNIVVPEAASWFQEVSYGRAALDIVPAARWYRMSKPSADYRQVRGLGSAAHRAYFAEAIQLASADVDFSQYSIVYIFPSSYSHIDTMTSLRMNPGKGVAAGSTEVRFVVTVSEEMYRRRPKPDDAPNALVHETLHMLGMPDLYDYRKPGLTELHFAGSWDIMSACFRPGAGLSAWTKHKLGWLDTRQLKCLNKPGSVDQTITPVSTADGVKAIVVRVNSTRAYVVEARAPIGVDSKLCGAGVLVYTVDAAVPNGDGPMNVIAAKQDHDESRIKTCASKYDAAFGFGPDAISTYSDPAAGFGLTVLSHVRDEYKVRVTLVGQDGIRLGKLPRESQH